MTSLALAEARARFSPLLLDFGSVQVGTTATAQLSFENVGGLPINVSQVYVVSDTFVSGDFTLTSGCTGPVAPGAGCTITVSFKPSQAVTRNESVRVVSGAGWLLARLMGTGHT
jgi:hypothetical protein